MISSTSQIPKPIEEYFIEHDIHPGELAAKVNQRIKKGWQPFGTLQVAAPVLDGSVAPEYYQAMVRFP